MKRFVTMLLTAIFICVAVSTKAQSLVISEFRTSGPSGSADEYVEIYNNSNSSITIAAPGIGCALVKSGAAAADPGIVVGLIPNGTVIPARGHFLFGGSTYSLANYGGTNSAAPNIPLAADIENDRGIALFNTSDPAGFILANRLDAVGSSNATVSSLYKEGTGYIPVSGSTLNYCFQRKTKGEVVQDADNNSTDLIFIDNAATNTPAGQSLGVPGPQNLTSPIVFGNSIRVTPADATKAPNAAPNFLREVISDPANNSTFGTIALRFKVENIGAQAITRLRLRIDSITTALSVPGFADLRLRNSSSASIIVEGPTIVSALGLTLEQPPVQSSGGGFNSSMTFGTITLGTPFAAGASLYINLVFGVQQQGLFNLIFTPEGLPYGGNSVTVRGTDVGGPFSPPPPSVTINQASGQDDPTTNSPINFTVVFSKPVTGFSSSDVTLSGTAGATTAVVTEIAPNDGTTFNVAVSGMTTSGTVIATIPSGAAIDDILQSSLASTSTDNTVTYSPSQQQPTVTCPGDKTVNVESDRCGATVNFAINNTVTATGSPAPTIKYKIENENGSTTSLELNSFPESIFFETGVNTVTVTATNSEGASTCSFIVTVIDNLPPTLTCPADIVVNTDAGQSTAKVSFTVGTESHCSDDRISITSNVGISGTGPVGNVPFDDIIFPVGVNTVTITATDPHNNSSSCSFTVTVEPPTPPTITCPNNNLTIYTDPGKCNARIDFSEENLITVTGSPAPKIAFTSLLPNGTGSSGSGFDDLPTIYFNVGVNTVTFTATNSEGTATCSFTVTVIDNQPPVIVCPEDKVVNAVPGTCKSATVPFTIIVTEGCRIKVSASSGTNGVSWEINGGTNMEFNGGLGFPVGINTVSVTAADASGNTSTCSFTVTVNDVEKPVITSKPSDVTVECTSQIPEVNIALVTATDNCGSPTITHVGDVISDQTCANKYTVTRTYQATDGAGNTTTAAQIITVDDQTPPTITGLSPSKQILAPPNHKMVDIALAYTINDNCSSTPNVNVSIASNEPVNGTGDGDTDPDWQIIDNKHIRLRAERSAQGTGRIYTITVTVNDGCNAAVSATTEVVVAHNITGPNSGNSFKVGSTVAFTGEFWDAPGNTHTSKWLIDGSTTAKGVVTEPSGNKNGKVTGSYKFTAPGVYKLQMNIIDQKGVTTYANTNGDVDAIVVIYDPNGGNTYGGGYFNSPAGALVEDPNATGKASYGFAMNYFKNSTNPKGETQFEFKVGEFEYNALNFDYLVISNSMAQFKGTGKIIGGQSGIGFTMTVVDGQLDGTGVDKIRLKIYNKNNGRVIYDNQPGASDAALPTQAVGANSTVVISGNNNSNLTKSNGTTQQAAMETTDTKVVKEFEAVVYPNPSVNNFSVTVQTDAKEKIMMQVLDMFGRIIETRNVSANSIIRFGDRYKAGTYFIKIIQGKYHKELKLIKLTD
jgi:hypothetical protein